MSAELERRFHKAMVNVYQTAKAELGYSPTRFIQMVSEQGGLQAARSLLASSSVSDGFLTLWEHRRLDLTVEAHVLNRESSELFSPDELEVARNRLSQYGWETE